MKKKEDIRNKKEANERFDKWQEDERKYQEDKRKKWKAFEQFLISQNK